MGHGLRSSCNFEAGEVESGYTAADTSGCDRAREGRVGYAVDKQATAFGRWPGVTVFHTAPSEDGGYVRQLATLSGHRSVH